MTRPPKIRSEDEQKFAQMANDLDNITSKVKSLDPMNKGQVEETEEQTKLSDREIAKYDAPYIKPARAIFGREPFNEKFRKTWEKAWEYVKCIVEQKECPEEIVEKWTKEFPGDPAHFWEIPVNKPIYLPRFVAHQITQCNYRKLIMDQSQETQRSGIGTMYGALVVEKVEQRIDCKEARAPIFSFGS